MFLSPEEFVVPSLDYFINRMSVSGCSKFFMHRALVKALQSMNDLRMNRFLTDQSYYTRDVHITGDIQDVDISLH